MQIVLSNSTKDACEKVDDGCFVCPTAQKTIRQLTCELFTVTKATLKYEGAEKDVWVCNSCIEEFKEDPSIEVIR